MSGIAKFEKVSFEQFAEDWRNTIGDISDDELLEIYNNIKLPRRATVSSAGYDFFLPANVVIGMNGWVNLPTGIKCQIDEGWVLQMYPRSGHGFKYGLHLANTVGIIDGDYYGNISNEGHIFVKLVNDSMISDDITLNGGTAFCQGVFVRFGMTVDDETSKLRTGGFGSTERS